MSIETSATPGALLRDLGDGLVLRRGSVADTGALGAFTREIFGPRASACVIRLLQGDWSVCDPTLFTVVEDTRSGAIVSSLCLLQQHWSYAGIPFAVGQPEFVLTHPDYRNRGLIREQFAVIHRWSEERGDLVQAITGIPYYYRQFGYEMTLPLGGGRMGFAAFVPPLKTDATEPFQIRLATEADLPFITQLAADNLRRRSLVVNERTEDEWRYILSGWGNKAPFHEDLRIIERKADASAAAQPIGFFWHHTWLRSIQQLAISAYEVVPGISWLAVTPTVLRALCALGESYAAANRERAAAGETDPTAGTDPAQPEDLLTFSALNFWLGAEHPLFDLYPNLLPRRFEPYAWYLRVPDLPAFLRLITPVLEERLAASAAAGHSGEIKLNFYRHGLRLVFEQGKLQAIEPWQPQVKDGGDVRCAGHTFLHLLFGHRTLDEINAIYPDCYAKDDAAHALIALLFPKLPSNVVSWATDG